MKKKQLERKLRQCGWWRLREGRRHEVWTNGTETEAVPRHREIADMLAKKILSTALRYPGDGDVS